MGIGDWAQSPIRKKLNKIKFKIIIKEISNYFYTNIVFINLLKLLFIIFIIKI